MSLASARREAERLEALLVKHGVKVSIELQAGRPWSGDAYYSRKVGLMNHHTAGPSKGLTPSLFVCKNGRGGANPLPGPLCNGYGGRDHVYRIVTLGLANHPGLGGPLVLAGVTIPKNSARISMWGTEWEHNGTTDWPEDMQEFMGRSNAALLEWMGRPVSTSIEHKTWAPGRKPDRYKYTASTGQAEIKRWGGKVVTKPSKPTTPSKPPVISKPKPLTVDGDWGPATWKRTQMLVRTPQTGKQNAATMRALQVYLGMEGSSVSGLFSNDTKKHLQVKAGLRGKDVDGVLGPISIKAWQRYLNRALS